MQAVGLGEGVEKRVDVVAMTMQLGGTVFDLEEAELCYAPQVRGRGRGGGCNALRTPGEGGGVLCSAHPR